MSNLQRKITMKSITGGVDIEELIKAPGQHLDLALLRGIARRYKPDDSPLGSFVRFYGSFRATNMQTGEVQDAPQIIVPPTLQDLLYAALGEENQVKEVAFAVKIGVNFDKTAIAKYVYTVESLMQPAESDPLSMMDKDLASTLAALPKPPVQGALLAPVANPLTGAGGGGSASDASEGTVRGNGGSGSVGEAGSGPFGVAGTGGGGGAVEANARVQQRTQQNARRR